MGKFFILNADDFGLSKEINRAILEGYNLGFMQSASLVANGEAFDEAVEKIIPKCTNLGVGIHLNVMEGKSLANDLFNLTNSNGYFNNSYIQLLIKSYSPNNKTFLLELETEFRAQIEKILSKTKVTHIDSHIHIHSIPKIFDLVCKLAKEYGINHVRTQREKFNFVPNIRKYTDLKIFINIIKVIVLKIFTKYNNLTIRKYGLSTNDYIIGVLYTSMMDVSTVFSGLVPFIEKNDDVIVEAIIHPARYEDGTVNNKFNEFLIIKNNKLKENIEKYNFRITNYAK